MCFLCLLLIPYFLNTDFQRSQTNKEFKFVFPSVVKISSIYKDRKYWCLPLVISSTSIFRSRLKISMLPAIVCSFCKVEIIQVLKLYILCLLCNWLTLQPIFSINPNKNFSYVSNHWKFKKLLSFSHFERFGFKYCTLVDYSCSVVCVNSVKVTIQNLTLYNICTHIDSRQENKTVANFSKDSLHSVMPWIHCSHTSAWNMWWNTQIVMNMITLLKQCLL